MQRANIWGPLLAWCAVIFWFSNQPDLDLQHLTPHWRHAALLDHPLRKLAHALEYAVLFVLARRGWTSGRSWLFCLAYAASDEWHQTFVAGRAGRLSDVALDAAAAALPWLGGRVSPLLRFKQ